MTISETKNGKAKLFTRLAALSLAVWTLGGCDTGPTPEPPSAPTSLTVGEVTFEGYMPTKMTIPLSADVEAGATVKYMNDGDVITVEGGNYKTTLGTAEQGASSKDFNFTAKAVKDGLESAEASTDPATTRLEDRRSEREKVQALVRDPARRDTSENPFPISDWIQYVDGNSTDEYFNILNKTADDEIDDLKSWGLTKAITPKNSKQGANVQYLASVNKRNQAVLTGRA